jgi:hypothetical protein
MSALGGRNSHRVIDVALPPATVWLFVKSPTQSCLPRLQPQSNPDPYCGGFPRRASRNQSLKQQGNSNLAMEIQRLRITLSFNHPKTDDEELAAQASICGSPRSQMARHCIDTSAKWSSEL